MWALKISTEYFFELKYLRFIRNTVQIIALLHHLWFVIYKRLLSNTRNDLKGLRGENLFPSAQKWNLNAGRQS
jgi:hypothetical protein